MAAAVRVVVASDLHTLADDAGMGDMLWRKAQAVLSAAQTAAPRRSGRYAGSFGIRWAHTDRRVVQVFNDAPYALDVEYGGSTSTRHRTLGHAVDAAAGV